MQHNWAIYNLTRNISDGLVTLVDWGCESNLEGFGEVTSGQVGVSGSSSDEGFIP